MLCDNDQFITSQPSIYPFVSCFAASTMLHLSVGGAGGTLLEEGIGPSGSPVLSVFLPLAPCALLLSHLCTQQAQPPGKLIASASLTVTLLMQAPRALGLSLSCH